MIYFRGWGKGLESAEGARASGLDRFPLTAILLARAHTMLGFLEKDRAGRWDLC